MPDDDFPSRLRAARERLGLTQRAAADKLGCTPAYVSQIETGHREVSLDQRHGIAVALGVDPHALDGRLRSVKRRTTERGPERG